MESWARASIFLAVAAVASVAILEEEVAASEAALGVVALLVVVLVVEPVVLAVKTLLLVVAVVVLRLWRRPSQVSLVRTILSFPLSLRPRSSATVRLMVATTPIQKQSARLSTSAPTTATLA